MLAPMDVRRSLPTLGLVALLLLDLVLVVWAVWPKELPRSPSAATSSVPSASPSPSPSPTPTAAVRAVPLTRLVAGVDAEVAWLADAGSCTDPGRIHITSDGGAEFASVDAPGSVTRVRASDARTGFVVGGDEDCRTALWDTGAAGEEWTPPRAAEDAWGRDPDDRTRVHRPAGEPVAPCRGSASVLDLAGLRDGVASAACSDGTLRTTTDGGSAWSTTFTRKGLFALSLTAPGRGAMAFAADGCAGVGVARISEGQAGAVQCVTGVTPRAGQVSVSVVADATWLVVGDRVLRAPSADASKGKFAAVGTWPRG